MRHLIAPSSMLEVAPTSIQSSSQKGMRTHRQSLSRSRRDTPSYGDDERRQRASALGAAEFITKPVDFDARKTQLRRLPNAAD
jgi:hypothetical protein